uniref:MscS-Like mechanosensitive ion channel MSCL15 n=1 Tax=Tetraselmis sp. GSL018 TaxID=582737 RepID=A0A061SMR3_9CHLO
MSSNSPLKQPLLDSSSQDVSSTTQERAQPSKGVPDGARQAGSAVRSQPQAASDSEGETSTERGDDLQANLTNADFFVDVEVADPHEEEYGCSHSGSSCCARNLKFFLLVLINLTCIAVIAAEVVRVLKASPGELTLFRWVVFGASTIPIYSMVGVAVKYLYYLLELYFYREPLYQFHSLEHATHYSVFFILELLWYFVVFQWAFCSGRHAAECSRNMYVQATTTLLRVMECLLLASIANLIAAIAANKLSTHFLKSNHFKKLQNALENEYKLKILSDPRRRRKPNRNQGQQKNSGLRRVSSRSSALDANLTIPEHSSAPSVSSTAGTSIFEPGFNASCTDNMFQADFGMPESRRDVAIDIDPEALQAAKLELLEGEDREVHNLSEQEMENLRTAVVLKTSSALVRHYKHRTQLDYQQQIDNVKAFAKALYFNIRGRGNERAYIAIDDVRLFYPDTKEGREQAKSTFGLFAPHSKAKVSKQQVIDAVLSIYKERADIAASLTNTESMIATLRGSIAAGLHFVFLVLYMMIWRINIWAGFSAFSASALALSFVFGNSIKNMFESMLFLFVQHPYDIGDWIILDGTPMEVVQISLLNTTFYDNVSQPTIVPNVALMSRMITNISRCDSHQEALYFDVDIGMATVVKDEVRHRLFELTKNHPNDFKTSPLWVAYIGTSTNLKAKLLVMWTYACAPAEWNRRIPLRDRAIQLVTDTIAKHQGTSVGYTYSYNLNFDNRASNASGEEDGSD